MGKDSWSLDRNHFLKELAKWSDGISTCLVADRFEELKQSLLVEGLSMVYKFFVMF